MKDVQRYARTVDGQPSVMWDGMMWMLQSLAEQQNSLVVSCNDIKLMQVQYYSISSFQYFFAIIVGGEAVNGSMFGDTDLSFVAANVQCSGSEFYVSECENKTVIPAECTADRIAGARCVPGSSKLIMNR